MAVRSAPRPSSLVLPLVAAAVVLLATCARDSTAPPIGRPAALYISPVFPSHGAGGALVIDSIEVIVTRDTGDTVAGQGASYPVGSSQIVLGIVVPLTADSEDLAVTLELFAGPVLLFQGSQTGTIHAGAASGDAIPVSVAFVGPGANVASLAITPRDTILRPGDSLTFGLTALDGQRQSVTQFYASWATSAAGVAIGATGHLVAPQGRQALTITAITPTGVRDSTRLTIVPAPSQIAKVSGDNQSAIAGDRLPAPIAVVVRAADNLPVPGIRVTFAVASGAGSVDSATVTTDSGGMARTGVQLGGTTGAQTFTASIAAGASVTFSATAVAAGPISRLWTGLLGIDWSNPGNWNPIGIPTLLDHLTIGTAINLPVLSVNAVAGSVTIDGLGVNLALNGHTLVTNTLSVVNGATITLDKALDSLLVNGSIALDAGDELGKLTAGVLTIGGNFTQHGNSSPNSFAATGLRTILTGGADQTLAFDSPGAAQSHFAGLLINKTSGVVTLATSVFARDSIGLLTPTALLGSTTLTVGRKLRAVTGATLGIRSLTMAGDSLLMGRASDYGVSTTTFTAAGPQLIPALPYQDLILSGGSSHTLAGRTIVSGLLTVTGSAASLVPGGRTLSAGSFLLQNGALLTMTQALDSLLVAGGFDIDGRSETGKLTAGLIAVGGNVTQRGNTSATSFAATGTRTRLNGTGNQVITFDNPGQSFLHDLVIAKPSGTVGLASALRVADSLAITTATTLNGAGALTVGRKLRSAAGTVLGMSSLTMTADSLLVTTPANYAVATTTFNGAGPQVIPVLPYASLMLSGASTHALRGRTTTSGLLTLSGATATLVTSGHTLAANALTIANGGLLRMTQPADSVLVTGAFDTDARDESSDLTAGVLAIGGNLVQRGNVSPASFAASGLRTVLNGAATQTVTMATAQSHFHDLIVTKSGGSVLMAGPTSINDSMAVTSATQVAGSGSLTVKRKLSAAAGAALGVSALTMTADSLRIGTPANYSVASTTFDGAGPQLIPSLPFNRLTLAGGSTHSLAGTTAVTGVLSVTSSAANLVLGGHTLVTGGFLLSGGGLLTMKQPADSMVVRGDFDTDAGDETGNLTAGAIDVAGDFTQRGNHSAASFAPSATRTRFTGGGNQTITFANPGTSQSGFHDLELSKSGGAAVLASPVVVDSALIVQGGADTIRGGTLTAGAFNVNGLVLDNAPLVLNSLHAVAPVFNNATFLNFAPTATQLSITQPGLALPISLSGLTFLSTPTTGYYVSANNAGLVPLTLLISSNLTPSVATLLTQLLNGALVTWQ